MIFFGSMGEHIDLGSAGVHECAACEREREFRLMLTYRKGHVFWIPLLHWSEKYLLLCVICGRGFEAKASVVKEALAGANPIPWMHRYGWLFVGAAVVIGTIVYSAGL